MAQDGIIACQIAKFMLGNFGSCLLSPWMLTMRRLRTWVVLGILMELSGARGQTLRANEPPVYEVYAVRFARLVGYPVASLVKGADRGRKLDLAMTFWVLKGPEGKTILIDAGFYRPEHANRKDVADYTRPDKALDRLLIRADQVTDIIITHMHWDHADGVDLFPKAQIWIQKNEYDHSAGADRKTAANDDGTLPGHYQALIKLKEQGRVHLVDGDAQ